MDWVTGNSENGYVAPEPEPTQVQTPLPAHRHGGHNVVVVALVFAVALLGFTVGHWVITPKSSVAVPQGSNGFTIPSGGFGSGIGSGSGNGGGNAGGGFTLPNGFGSGSQSISPTSNGGAKTAKLASKVDKGLVDVTSSFLGQSATAEGTGMVISSNGLVLTNNHVIEDASSISVRVVSTGATYSAKVIGFDLSQDVAVLQLANASGLTMVTTANSSSLTNGESIVGVGNALGAGGTPSYTAGTITGLDKAITASDSSNPAGAEHLSGLIQVNADVLPGDSGGALVNAKGQVIGMVTAGSGGNGGFGFQPNGVSSSQGYAIPINTALRIASAIENGQSSSTIHVGSTAYLGVEFQSTTNESAKGVTISTVVAGGPSAKAGLVTGDVITSVNGAAVTTGTSLQKVMLTLNSGQTVKVGFTHAGATHVVSVTLGSGPPQ